MLIVPYYGMYFFLVLSTLISAHFLKNIESETFIEDKYMQITSRKEVFLEIIF